MRAWILAMTLFAANPGSAGDLPASTPQPGWSSLTFVQKKLWVTVESTVRLDACAEDAGPAHWCLTADSSVGDNTETISVQATAAGTLVRRERASAGRERRRIKRWHYDVEGITRSRLEPDCTGEYQLTSRRELGYPAGKAGASDPLLLLLLAAPGATGEAPRRDLVVHTDLNFYTVTVSVSGRETIAADFRLDGQAVSEPRDVVLVTLEARPVEPLADKPDFSLQGLTGTITIAYDASTGIPLQVRGWVPRLGPTAINLVAATRPPASR